MYITQKWVLPRDVQYYHLACLALWRIFFQQYNFPYKIFAYKGMTISVQWQNCPVFCDMLYVCENQ